MLGNDISCQVSRNVMWSMLYHLECNVRLVETSRDQCYTIWNAMLSQ